MAQTKKIKKEMPLQSGFPLWFAVCLVPFAWIVLVFGIQKLFGMFGGNTGVMAYISSDPFALYIFYLFPSYMVLLLRVMPWEEKIKQTLIFILPSMLFAVILNYAQVFAACYIFSECLYNY